MALTRKILSSDSGEVGVVTEQMRERFGSSNPDTEMSCGEEELCSDH